MGKKKNETSAFPRFIYVWREDADTEDEALILAEHIEELEPDNEEPIAVYQLTRTAIVKRDTTLVDVPSPKKKAPAK